MASFLEFAQVCQALSQTHSRLQMAELAGDLLSRLAPEEAVIAARFLIGRALPVGEEAKLNLSGRAVWRLAAELTGALDQGEDIFAAAVDFGEAVELAMRRRTQPPPTLTITEVEAYFRAVTQIEGSQARARKLAILRELLARADALEAKYVAKILIREMRHGMNEGVLLEAIARAAARPLAEVRRAGMLEGDPGRLLRTLLDGPGRAPAERSTELKPLKPMLAQSALSVAEAFAILGPRLALEHKLDGARVQLHHAAGQTRIFSRRLNEITASLPEITEQIANRLSDTDFILDGEVLAVDGEGRPLAFQDLMRRFRRIREVERLRREAPVRLFVFDLLACDGRLLIDQAYHQRFEALSELAARGGLELVGRLLPASPDAGELFFRAALAAGFEGVMAKALESTYTPGSRGRGWLKIKGVRTLDLVIVAADWGYGRRHGWLSNYHLAARGPAGELFEVGKTFKGPSDQEFAELTQRLLALKLSEAGGTVRVRPELVVEVAFNDIQKSPRYACGMALRFARIVRLREDKTALQADTIEALEKEFAAQIVRP
ncbi:MAG TPA: ATP-dependent DNA ligase, partial [Candidatus Binataceae bacterium]|nr:ATP-dependent DNA ligase [Candidatus Binataceae bacterium]